jgi:hypothetical protein
MMQTAGYSFCCDQRIEYIPRIDTFVWVLLSKEGPLMLALASPDELRNSNGKSWTYYDIGPTTFRLRSDSTFDYPQIAFGDHYLYLTVNAVETNQAVITRFPLNELGDRATLHGQHIKADWWYVGPCHNTREAGWFGVLKSVEYIGISILDFGIGQVSMATQHSMWNPDFAFAWPSLAASPVLEGVVAISCCFGGGRRYPQHAVGILGTYKVTATTSGKSAGAGGHYNDVRLCFPQTDQFVASGFHTAKNNSNPPQFFNHLKYVIFKP